MDVAIDAIQNGVQMAFPKQAQIFEENLDGHFARFAQWQGSELVLLQRRGSLPSFQVRHDFCKVARKLALPAQGIDSILKGSRGQLMETRHPLDAWIVGWKGKLRHG
jgi:hypothetical protein